MRITAASTVLVLVFILPALWTLVPQEASVEEEMVQSGGSRAVITVGWDQTYVNIQDAVDAASPGDTIRIYAGIWCENVWVNKTLSFIGNGSADSVLGGNEANTVFNVTAPYCNFTALNFTLTGVQEGRAGLRLHSGGNTVSDCAFYLNHYGIFATDSDAQVIRNSTFTSNYRGIKLVRSNLTIIRNCTTMSSEEHGIHLQFSDSAEVSNCSAFSDNQTGIFIDDCKSGVFRDNTMEGCGFDLFGGGSYSNYDSHAIGTDNTVNGKPVYYWKNVNGGSVPADAGQVIVVYSSNIIMDGLQLDRCSVGLKIIQSNGCTVANVNSSNNLYGAHIVGNDHLIKNSRFEGCNVSGLYMNGIDSVVEDCLAGDSENEGITLEWCENITVRNCTLTGTAPGDSRVGLVLTKTSNSAVTGSDINNCGHGASLWRADGNTFSRNNIHNNVETGTALGWLSKNNIFNDCDFASNQNTGLSIGVWAYNGSNGNTVEECRFTQNGGAGLHIQGSGSNEVFNNTFGGNQHGISVSDASKNTIRSNRFHNQTGNGLIMLADAVDNRAEQNLFEDNTQYGAAQEGGSSANAIVHNNFINNNGGSGKQVLDVGASNVWYESGKGNYYSDWTGPDLDKDGIVDNPYNIDGMANSKDLFPAAHPFGTFIIITQDVSAAFEDELYSVNYTVFAMDVSPVTTEWEMATNATSWLNLTDGFVLEGTPRNEDVGIYWVRITAASPLGTDSTNFTLRVYNSNDPPVIETEPVVTAVEDELYEVQYNATDMDPTNDGLVWDLFTTAGFLMMNPTTGVLSGIPLDEHVGVFNVSVSVTDNRGGFDWSNFTLSVENVNDAPEGFATNLTIKEDDQEFFVKLSSLVADPDGDEITVFLPKLEHLSVSREGGIMNIVPALDFNGYENFTFIATDGILSTNVSVFVRVAPVNDAPSGVVITGVDNNTVLEEGDMINLTAEVTDVDIENEGDSFVIIWRSDVSGQLGTGEALEGLVLSVGTHRITVRATDDGGEWAEGAIVVVVEPRGTGPDDDIVDDDVVDDDDDDDDDTGVPLLFILLPVFVAVVLILVILGVLVFLLKRRATQEEEHAGPPQGRAAPPGTPGGPAPNTPGGPDITDQIPDSDEAEDSEEIEE